MLFIFLINVINLFVLSKYYETEFLKLLNKGGIKWIVKIFNKIYDTRDIPKKGLKPEFIALPKKMGATKCEEHRIISLMSHILSIKKYTESAKKKFHQPSLVSLKRWVYYLECKS